MTTKRVLRTKATAAQTALVNSTSKFPAMVSGFGAGKTQALMLRGLRLKLKYPTLNIGYYLPTYDLVKMIGYPRFSEVLRKAGIRFKLNKAEHVITVHGRGKIIFRTLDTPERIVGYEVGDSLVDELDTLKAAQAEHCWNQIIARNRQKKPDGMPNTVAVGTTPEGFRFVYRKWKKTPKTGYELIHASTQSNARNLPVDYVQGLLDTYPPALISAYLDGQFVNLTSGSVYPNFDRVLNHSSETMQKNEPLHIGLDFNRLNMTAVIGVIRDGLPITVDELTGVRDTPEMARLLNERYKNAGHSIIIYPDASGQNASSKNATESDFTILRQAGFVIKVDSRNPAVMDRVNSVNAMILNASGVRRWKINTEKCPQTTEAFEQQVYDKNGEPDKSSNNDHAPDAWGYFIYQRFPIINNQASQIRIGGMH